MSLANPYHSTLNVSRNEIADMKGMLRAFGERFYVSKNVSNSGDGKSREHPFKTIKEAITAVNFAYTNQRFSSPGGRGTVIYIDEGWYSETGMTLTASDCTIISVASGSGINDGTVLYGSATAGGWDAGAVVPALTITGSSNSFYNVGFMNSASGLYPCITIGAAGANGPSNNAFYNCFWPRDVADAYTFGVNDLSNEGSLYRNCYFSQSAKTAGISINTNGVFNPVNNWIEYCKFIGTPVGVYQGAGHNTIIKGNWFIDASDDRPDTIDNPINIVVTSAFATGNFAPNNSLAEFDAGTVAVCLGNICSDSDATDWPNGG